MAAFLIVDVDDLIRHFRRRNISLNLQELAVGLRGSAALATGLADVALLRAIAVANWEGMQVMPPAPDPQYLFRTIGYETFDSPQRAQLADALFMQYFAFDSEPVEELILATTNRDLLPLVQRIKAARAARVRVWTSGDLVRGTPYDGQVIQQPLDSLIGIRQTKNVALYIDFENIAISLSESGYVVNLDRLLASFRHQGEAHGQIIDAYAYAPWRRGSLPPLLDEYGREITDDATTRFLEANINPIITLPGKNSADMKMAKDITSNSQHGDSADIYIIASGDRDFRETINTLRGRGKQVILWSVQGTISRHLQTDPTVTVEFIEDFALLQSHQAMMLAAKAQPADTPPPGGFMPSQWSSVIFQYDYLLRKRKTETVSRKLLIERLLDVGAVISSDLGEELIAQAIALGILKKARGQDRLGIDLDHPVVAQTLHIRDRLVLRVTNTLLVRNWEYVNYGFLLKGLSMDRDLERPGMNRDDQWRSDWIDCLVRDHILLRKLIPHRQNPDDLVPVILVHPDYTPLLTDTERGTAPQADTWAGVGLEQLIQTEPDTAAMSRRIVVSIEQFISFRGFTWCPLGSLHRRLRSHDRASAFQRAVEYLVANESVEVREYPNPESDFLTKGISLVTASAIVHAVLRERDRFICLLLSLYERNTAITSASIAALDTHSDWDFDLWFSIMLTENVLNAVPGRPGQYSLFRTHHTVSLVADSCKQVIL